jgi:transposase
MPALIEVPLDLPHVRVLQTCIDGRDLIVTVESTLESATCPHCGEQTSEFHSYGKTIRLRHLPVFGLRTWIELRPKRFICRRCPGEPTTTQQLPWYEVRSPHTKAYDDWLMLNLINSTEADVARKCEVSEEEVLGALRRQVKASVAWESFTRLGVMGLDEIARKRGHDDFIVLVTSKQPEEELRLLAVLPDRKKETVIAFLRTIPEHLRETIAEVCIDMYEGYANAVKEVLPGVPLVVDRFHVAKAYRECADKLRKREMRELKECLGEDEYAGLKGVMWGFRRSPQSLKEEQKAQLELLFECAPELKKAYQLREDLTAIFETRQTKEEGAGAFREWQEQVRLSGLQCFDSFLTTLDNWFEQITNYFTNRQTSGFVEGFNHKVKVLKRRCYGIFNLAHLFRRLFLDLEGYRLYARE